MLAKHVAGALEPGRPYKVVTSRGLQDFHNNAGMPARVLAHELTKLGAKAECFEIDFDSSEEPRPRIRDPRLMVPDLASLNKRYPRCDALVHIPTCFHDKAIFRQKIAKRWPHALEIASPFWDVPLAERPKDRIRLSMRPIDHPSRRDRRILDYASAYRDRMLDEFRDLLPPQAAAEQADYLAAGAGSQAIWFLGLQELSDRFPGTHVPLIISSHDGGLCGPLWTWAQSSGAEIHVLPHSAAQAELLPAARNVTAYADRRFRYPAVTIDFKQVATKYVTLRAPLQAAAAPTGEIRSIGVVTSVFSWGECQTESSRAFVDFCKSLHGIVAPSGIRLLVRFKPGHSAFLFCSRALGIPVRKLVDWTTKISLEQFAAECDLALFCGELTTGAATFVSLVSVR